MAHNAQRSTLNQTIPSTTFKGSEDASNNCRSWMEKGPPAASTGSSTTQPRTFRNPSISLRSRLPWLDRRGRSKSPSFNRNTDATHLRSESQTTLLPMTAVHSTTYEMLSPSLHETRGQGDVTFVPEPLAPRLNSTPGQPQTTSSQAPASPQSSLANTTAKIDSIRLKMTPPTIGDMHPQTEKTPVLDSTPRKQSLIKSVFASKGYRSPILNPDPTDSLPEFDASPLTRAIQHLEVLMKEAEDLVNDAAESGNSSEVEDVFHHSSEAVRASKATAADMAISSPEKRSFLVDASISDLSLDESDMSYAKTPKRYYETSLSTPIVRDFAYSQGRKGSKYQPEHWMGRRPTRTYSVNQRVPKLENNRGKTGDRKAHTAYISESPPSPRTPASANSLRKRKRSVQIVENERPEWRDWRRPRQNTYFDSSWHPALENKPPESRKVSFTPVPWTKMGDPLRHRCARINNCNNFDRDLEKAETANDNGNGGGHFRRRWTLGHAKDEPIARKWSPMRKRISAIVACLNTGMVGHAIGDYAGMVPRIQFQLADHGHDILLGNVYLFLGMAITTFLCWPLPLLHGRRPYILASLGLAIPLQFPQAILVSQVRPPVVLGFEFGLLTCRFLTGLLLGLTNINDFAMLLDLFGASLQSDRPHQEVVIHDDPRRDGGGIGIWLGIWAWCWVGSISLGFMSGAGIINSLNPQWGFYISTGLMICAMIFNVLAPETRHSSLRRTLRGLRQDGKTKEFEQRKVARGEIKLHLDDQGPRYWFQELWAGVILMKRMFFQRGFCVVSLYLGWMYGQNILVIILLGALLSRDYRLPSRYVGLGVLSVAIGALLAVPMTYAGWFSRARKQGPRTDSMTFEPQVTWTSHMVRRIAFMLMLPVAGAVYTVTSKGYDVHYMVPIVFAGAIGFFQSLAVAECYGLVMETFDTSDLQPGVNSRHRLQSLAENVKKRRTNYSSFPRVSAGIFLSQTIGFLFAAAATGVGGLMTREIGAQYSTGVTAGILMFLAVLLTGALFRFKSVQVIPNHAFGTRVGTFEMTPEKEDAYWKPVVIGNPSGKVRRMSLLELGRLSRWTEIRRLNKLL